MALFSDLLPYILQQQQTALPGGPNLGPAIPRSPTNVTAMNMPSAKLPGAFDFANAGNNFANVMGENVLRQQQAHLADLNAQHVGYQISLIPEFRKALDEFMSRGANPGGAGAGGSEQGGGLLQGSSASSGAAGSGKTVSLAMQESPEVQEAVAKKLAMESGIQHWSGIDPATGKPWNQKLFGLLQNAGLPTSGPLTEEQWNVAKPLVLQTESAGGKNIPNYKFGPGFTAGGPFQITNTTWNSIGGPQIAAAMKGSTGQPASAVPPGLTPQAAVTAQQPGVATPVMLPEVKSHAGEMGETLAPPPPPAAEEETPGDQGALPPSLGEHLVAQAQAKENLSPIDRLNQKMLAQLGGGQVAGDNASPSGGMSGGALPGILAGQMPTPTLAGRDPSLSMPFNPAAQQAAGPSPAVPSAPAGGPPAPTGTAAAGMAQALAAAKAAMPQGQQGGFQLDPMQAQMLKLGMLGQLSGMGNLTAPLERAFENSPWWQQRKAAAGAAGTAEGGMPYVFPRKMMEEAAGYSSATNNPGVQADIARARKTAESQVELEYKPQIEAAAEMAKSPAGITGLLAMAAQLPPDNPLRNIYLNAAMHSAMGTSPVVAQTRETPGQRFNPATNAFEPTPGALTNLEDSTRTISRTRGEFEAQPFYDARGNPSQGTRSQLPNQPVAPTMPGTNLGVGPALAPPSAAAVPGAAPAPLPIPPLPQSAAAAPPNFVLNTPAGPRQAGQATIRDLFPDDRDIPQRPPPLPGMGYGPLQGPDLKQQEADGDRLKGYAEEGSANQAVYQNLGHLMNVMQSGLVTGKLEPVWTDMANIANNLGIKDFAGPGGDPENAALLNKAATRLVFAGLGKLRGQVRNMEITGLGQANPNGTIPMAANVSILNDILSAGKWEDERNRLAHQYWYQTGHAPLAAFDTRFAQAAPLNDVTDKYKQTLQAAGFKFPGDRAEDAAMRIPEGRTATNPTNGHRIMNRGGVMIDLTTNQPMAK